MSWLDRFRKKRGELPLSAREKKIAEIATRAHDEDSVPYLKDGDKFYSEHDLVSDDSLLEAAEDRAEYGDDLQYPVGRILSMEQVLDEGWLRKKIRAGKKRAENEEKNRVAELKKLYPNSDLNWSKEYGQVIGISGVAYTQDGKFYDTTGREVLDPEM